MKKLQPLFCALLFSGVIAVACVLTMISNDSRNNSIQTESAGGLHDESNYGNMEIELGSNAVSAERLREGMFTAVRTPDEFADETGIDAALPPAATPARGHAAGIAGLSHVALMTEANQIMLELYRDGVLTEPSSYACAFPDTSPGTRTTEIILEQFRPMHQMHLALVKSLFTSGDQDSLVTRGWSEIRMHLVKLRTMAADVRSENALVTR